MINNARNFNKKVIIELFKKMKVKHFNSSLYRPKMHGVIEVTNKNIKKIIQKMVITYKDWFEMLPFTLQGYCTAVKTSTRAILYSLIYKIKALMPLEIEIFSLRVLMELKLEASKWVKLQYE